MAQRLGQHYRYADGLIYVYSVTLLTNSYENLRSLRECKYSGHRAGPRITNTNGIHASAHLQPCTSCSIGGFF